MSDSSDVSELLDLEQDQFFDEGNEGGPVNESRDSEDVDVNPEDPDSQVREAPEVKRRVNALLNNQLDMLKMRALMVKEMQEVERKYSELMKPLERKRFAIVTGEYEPRNYECDITHIPGFEKEEENIRVVGGPEGPDNMTESLNLFMENMAIQDDPAPNTPPVKGVPNFWLDAFRTSSLIVSSMDDHDFDVLKHLENITVDMFTEREEEDSGYGYKLTFYFSANPYFTNSTLTKTFVTSCDLNPRKPFERLDKPWPVKAIGCKINWLEGKDVTYRQIRRKQRSSRGGGARFVTLFIQCTSFFTFFQSIDLESAEPVVRMLSKEQLEDNFMIGEYIRRRLIPYGTMYYSSLLDEDMDREKDLVVGIGPSDDEEEDENPDAGYRRGKHLRNGQAPPCVSGVLKVCVHTTGE